MFGSRNFDNIIACINREVAKHTNEFMDPAKEIFRQIFSLTLIRCERRAMNKNNKNLSLKI